MAPNLQTFGYHNTFHIHSQPAILPSYESAISSSRHSGQFTSFPPHSETLPSYTCDVHFEGFLDVKAELATPFLVSKDTNWHTVYVVLHGTQLSLYRKTSNGLFRNRTATTGRLIITYTLQHAEIGLAADWKTNEPVPKSTFAKMLPKATQMRLRETDPELFEPVREFVMRLRLEAEQLLFCAPSHESLLDWIEQVCMGIDIAQPLDERNEPRFRSLPRRTRRQRQIEADAQGIVESVETLSTEEVSRRLVAQQERLFRRLYPNLASDAIIEQNEDRTEGHRGSERESELGGGQDPDAEDLDPADAREESSEGSSSSRPGTAQEQVSDDSARDDVAKPQLYDPKTAAARPDLSPTALLRFRRRCCPILLASSPRASAIIYARGFRYQINCVARTMAPFELSPPRYDPSTAPYRSAILPSIEGEEEGLAVRPRLDRGFSHATYASTSTAWTSTEAAEVTDVSSVHSNAESGTSTRLYGSLENLERMSSTATDTKAPMPANVMGKSRSLLFTVRTLGSVKVQQGHEHNDEAFATHAPFLL